MKPREVKKYKITLSQAQEISRNLKEVATYDPHAINGHYQVRSLYFDDEKDRAFKARLKDKKKRKIFRIRFYNNDTNFIRLEKKIKRVQMGNKIGRNLNYFQVKQILDGRYEFLNQEDNGLYLDFYQKLNKNLEPKTIIEYNRKPFIYPTNNVRVTLDTNIRVSENIESFLDPKFEYTELDPKLCILEVKWSDTLPKIIQEAIDFNNRKPDFFSKYTAARMKLDIPETILPQAV